MKFGKHIQQKQLENPEYASSFVDYKALKKLIKELKNSPVTKPEDHGAHISNPQQALQANRAAFFFRLDRELDKVNTFYHLKEQEAKVRFRSLIDKQKSMRLRMRVLSRNSTHYITLEQGFKDFINDLSKLQSFTELNHTAFAKILKKWDKTSKSETKAIYLSRNIEVNPTFNHEVISELSDAATSALDDCAAWAEGDGAVYESGNQQQLMATPRLEQDDTDSDILDALTKGDVPALKGFIARIIASGNQQERLSRAYLTAVSSAPDEALKAVLDTGLVDLHKKDEINDRNCLHKTAMAGRPYFLKLALAQGVDPSLPDAYGRIPLHYACMNGHVDLISDLVQAKPQTIEAFDLGNFTPLIHAITHNQAACVEKLLSYSAQVDRTREGGHIPLNLACQYGSVSIVQLLLNKGPAIMKDAEGLYPQHIAARFGLAPQILLMLRDYGASLDQADKYNQWTPLFHAANHGRVECLRTLLELGVNAAATDEKGLTAQYYAIWEGNLECMAMLASATTAAVPPPVPSGLQPVQATQPTVPAAAAYSDDIDHIPELTLGPPMVPSRKYGHNFLDRKTTVLISLLHGEGSAVTFYDASKYPAARLTIVPKATDILPRNILLPITEDDGNIAFEMKDLEAFSIDFDVFAPSGRRVIAKGSVPAEVFMGAKTSFGSQWVPLLDPRLRSVGQVYFTFQVIRPFDGIPLGVTSFDSYWKSTSQAESKAPTVVTGSSLSGEYVRLYVQLSRDGVPVLCPHWTVSGPFDLKLPVMDLTQDQFSKIATQTHGEDHVSKLLSTLSSHNLPAIHKALASSYASLEFVLANLPLDVHIELHIMYANSEEERQLRLGPGLNMNAFVDNILKVVFQHVRTMRDQADKTMRGIVFTSYNKDLCTALNWKQPNFPVLLCNDLGAPSQSVPASSGRTAMSIKEAVRVAETNNFMGLVCRSQILDMVPALVGAITGRSLVLVSDASDGPALASTSNTAAPQTLPDGINGMLSSAGVMRFSGEAVDI